MSDAKNFARCTSHRCEFSAFLLMDSSYSPYLDGLKTAVAARLCSALAKPTSLIPSRILFRGIAPYRFTINEPPATQFLNQKAIAGISESGRKKISARSRSTSIPTHSIFCAFFCPLSGIFTKQYKIQIPSYY